MTTTPPEAPPPPQDSGPRVTRDEVRDLGRLRRSTTDRKVAGVAGGLGRHLDVDPLILRVAFVALVFFGGAGLILYGACWLLVPEDGDDRAPLHMDDRTRAVALLIVGGIAALAVVGDSWGAFWFPWPVAVVALVALWLLTRNGPRDRNAPGGPYAAPTDAPTQVNPYAGPAYVPPAATDAAAPAADPAAAAATAEAPTYPVPPPPSYVPPMAPPRVPNPRKRGPILFWFTLALIALSVGLLGIVDLAGADIADPAYPALAVAICGVMLLVGAFFGRAGGIIALGLVGSVALAGATAADQWDWDGDRIHTVPDTAAEVAPSYDMGSGEIILDLTDVSDLESLDGRTITLDGTAGQLRVLVPEDLAVRVYADLDWWGNINLFGQEHGGYDFNETTYEGDAGEPRVTIDAHLGVGQIEVSHR